MGFVDLWVPPAVAACRFDLLQVGMRIDVGPCLLIAKGVSLWPKAPRKIYSAAAAAPAVGAAIQAAGGRATIAETKAPTPQRFPGSSVQSLGLLAGDGLATWFSHLCEAWRAKLEDADINICSRAATRCVRCESVRTSTHYSFQRRLLGLALANAVPVRSAFSEKPGVHEADASRKLLTRQQQLLRRQRLQQEQPGVQGFGSRKVSFAPHLHPGETLRDGSYSETTINHKAVVDFVEVFMEATTATEVTCVGFSACYLSFRAVPSLQELQCHSLFLNPRVVLPSTQGCLSPLGDTCDQTQNGNMHRLPRSLDETLHPTLIPLRHRYAVAPGGLPLAADEFLQAEALSSLYSGASSHAAKPAAATADASPCRTATGCCQKGMRPCEGHPDAFTRLPLQLMPPLFDIAKPFTGSCRDTEDLQGACQLETDGRKVRIDTVEGRPSDATRDTGLMRCQGRAEPQYNGYSMAMHPPRRLLINTSACSTWFGSIAGLLAVHGAFVCRLCLTTVESSALCKCAESQAQRADNSWNRIHGFQLGLVVALEEAATGRVMLVLLQNAAALSLLRHLGFFPPETTGISALESCAAALLQARQAAQQLHKTQRPWHGNGGCLLYDALSCSACNAAASWLLPPSFLKGRGVIEGRTRIRIEGLLRPISVGQTRRFLTTVSCGMQQQQAAIKSCASQRKQQHHTACVPVIFAVDWQPASASVMLRELLAKHTEWPHEHVAV